MYTKNTHYTTATPALPSSSTAYAPKGLLLAFSMVPLD